MIGPEDSVSTGRMDGHCLSNERQGYPPLVLGKEKNVSNVESLEQLNPIQLKIFCYEILHS
jgi:hypothetical protein